MNLDYIELNALGKKYEGAFYLLYPDLFIKNYHELINAFKAYYPKTNIAYSYKTNYIPKLCSVVNDVGGYAEIVSSMEFELAKKIGVDYKKIYFNGPYKDYYAVEELLVNGGIVNVDSLEDFYQVQEVAYKHPMCSINIGIRLNYSVDDGVISRFGFDVNDNDLNILQDLIAGFSNIHVVGIHTHFAQRSLEIWKSKIEGLEKYIKPFFQKYDIRFVSLGGGMYGKMHDSLVKQFQDYIPTFEEYALVAAKGFAKIVSSCDLETLPELLIEPGTALVGDAMKFCSKVFSIKKVQNVSIATLKGSIYNINPTLNTKKPPLIVVGPLAKINESNKVFDLAGYTCIESDYLYKGYRGDINVGDYVVFSNVGSYSIVLKPPFILPNFPIIEWNCKNDSVLKKQETFLDVFRTYNFEG